MKAVLFAIALPLCLSAFAAQAAEFSPSEICKAAVSVEMGRKAKSMKTLKQDPPEIAYQRDDGETFQYRCKLSGGKVVWKTFFSDTREWGRWRERYADGDALTTYSASSGALTIENDQAGIEIFEKKDF